MEQVGKYSMVAIIIPGESYPKTDNQNQNQGLDRWDDLATLHRYNYMDGGL